MMPELVLLLVRVQVRITNLRTPDIPQVGSTQGLPRLTPAGAPRTLALIMPYTSPAPPNLRHNRAHLNTPAPTANVLQYNV